MARLIFILLLVWAAGCGRQSAGSRRAAINTVRGIETRQVTHEGETWVEVSITQQVDPKAPAYVVGLRERFDFAGALIKQEIASDKVVSTFRIRPTVPTNKVVLDRSDFEWYPPVLGFPPVEVVLRPGEP